MIFWPLSERAWKVIIGCIVGLVLIGAVLFVSDRVTGWWSARKIDKLKANINGTLTNIATAEKQIANLREKQAAELAEANVAVKEFNDEVGASEAARIEANKALEAVNAARNSNQVGVTVDELNKKLEALDR